MEPSGRDLCFADEMELVLGLALFIGYCSRIRYHVILKMRFKCAFAIRFYSLL